MLPGEKRSSLGLTPHDTEAFSSAERERASSNRDLPAAMPRGIFCDTYPVNDEFQSWTISLLFTMRLAPGFPD